MSKEKEEILKLRKKVQELQKELIEIIKSCGKLASENMSLKEMLDKKTNGDII